MPKLALMSLSRATGANSVVLKMNAARARAITPSQLPWGAVSAVVIKMEPNERKSTGEDGPSRKERILTESAAFGRLPDGYPPASEHGPHAGVIPGLSPPGCGRCSWPRRGHHRPGAAIAGNRDDRCTPPARG